MMNRADRRALRHEHREHIKSFSNELVEVPSDEWPVLTPDRAKRAPMKVWRSRKYLVQLYHQNSPHYPDLHRLSICRVTLGAKGGWQDGLTWDELQAIKREVGFGDWYAVEVYPPDEEIVNVANMRHLWLLPVPLAIGWFK